MKGENGVKLRINKKLIYKTLMFSAVLVFLATAETTFFARFGIFGAQPGLLLAGTAALAVIAGPRAGGVFGTAAGFCAVAAGGSDVFWLPLLYMALGCAAGLFCHGRFLSGLPAFALSAGVGLAATSLSMFLRALAVSGFSAQRIFLHGILPYIGATVICALPVYYLVLAAHLPFREKYETEGGR